MHHTHLRSSGGSVGATTRVTKYLSTAGLAIITTAFVTSAVAVASPKQNSKKANAVASPLTMVVSLDQQRIYVYDKNGYVTQSKVSTGKRGHETPKGIYTIIQKKVDHSSNIYIGAKMPYMQRLLQTGIAIHGGDVPNYPASKGCIRLPYKFAPKLFAMTTMNERVVVTPSPQSPIPFAHENLFKALPKGTKTAMLQNASLNDTDVAALSGQPTISSIEAELRQEREGLVAKVSEAKGKAVAIKEQIATLRTEEKALKKELWAARKEAKKVSKGVWRLKKAKRNAERKLKKTRGSIAWAERKNKQKALEKYQAREEKLVAEIEELSASPKLAASEEAQAEVNKIADELKQVRKDIKAARKDSKKSAKRITTAEKAVKKFDRQQKKRHMPISMVITPVDGKLKIRQGWETILTAPVEIEDPDREIGTHLYTATDWRDDTQTELLWQALSVGEDNRGYADDGASKKKKKKKKLSRNATWPVPRATDEAKAAAALARIKIPEETRIKVAALVKPGSTLIVSDYDIAKSEVRAGTDYTVQMPEVIATIPTPTNRRRPVNDYYNYGTYNGNWSFFSSPPPPRRAGRQYRKPRKRHKRPGHFGGYGYSNW